MDSTISILAFGYSGAIWVCDSSIAASTECYKVLVSIGDVYSIFATSDVTAVAVSCWGAERISCSVGAISREA